MIPPEEKCEVQDLGTERNFFTLLPNIIFHFKLDPWAFKAYCVIKMTAGDKGSCFKSNSRMAEEIGCSIPTLIKLKNQLAEEGLIIIQKRNHPSGGNMPDLIQIVDIWGQNMEYMLKLHPKDPKNDHYMMGGTMKKPLTGGGKPDLVGGVNGVNGGSKPGLHKQDIKEEDIKRTTAAELPAAASSDEEYKGSVRHFNQKPQPPKISPKLHGVNIPPQDKFEIASTYDEKTIDDAIDWATDPSNPPKKCLAASVKFGCKNKLTKPIPKKADKIPVNPEAYNKTYYREVTTVAWQNGVRLDSIGLRDGNEYLQAEHDKIYFKDKGFLEQVANYLRKKSVDCRNIFDMIKACQADLVKQLC